MAKSLRVSEETHAALMRYTSGIGPVSVDYVLGQLLSPTTVHIPLTEGQRARWDAQAAKYGMSAAEFAKQRTEFALQLGTDQTTIRHMHTMLERITEVLLPEPKAAPRRRPLAKHAAPPESPKEDT